jgi:hypothetical protein
VRLITAHRILIGFGIAFFLFYALVQAIFAPLIALGFALYYRSLAKRWGK